MSEWLYSKVTRREALALGALAGLSAAVPQSASAAGQIITKPIPSTGEKLPVVGLGTNRFRGNETDAFQAVIKRLSELGGKVIDTAASYGDSEAVIGKAVAALGIRDKLFIATKLTDGQPMGPPPNAAPPPGMPPGGRPPQDNVGGRASFERSLQRLQVERIDLLMIHNLRGAEALMPLLLEWKKAGKIRYIGASTSSDSQHQDMVEAMKKYPWDFVEVNYSIANRAAEETVLRTALERKIAVLANVPFGGRGGRSLSSIQGHELPKWAVDAGITSWPQLLLKYAVSHPAVTAAIPGSTKVEHIEDNLAAARGTLPDAGMRKRMEALWDSTALA